MPRTSYGPGVIVLGLSMIGALLVVIRWVTLPRVSGAAYAGFSYGPRIGMILALIAVVAILVLQGLGGKVNNTLSSVNANLP